MLAIKTARIDTSRNAGVASSLPEGRDTEPRSGTLGLSLRPDSERVRLRKLATGKDYPWYSEKDGLIVALKMKITVRDERALRVAEERRAAVQRAATVEARAAKLDAYLAGAGIHVPEDI